MNTEINKLKNAIVKKKNLYSYIWGSKNYSL